MQECWINVYQWKNATWYGKCYSDEFMMKHNLISKPAYRIHVKMDGGFNKDGTRYMNKMRELNKKTLTLDGGNWWS